MTNEEYITVIEPHRQFISLNLRDLWRFRELFYILVWRDIKVRYKQTFLGVAWAVFQPVVSMVVFTLFFASWYLFLRQYPLPDFCICGFVTMDVFLKRLDPCKQQSSE